MEFLILNIGIKQKSVEIFKR